MLSEGGLGAKVINTHRLSQFETYGRVHAILCSNPEILIDLEKAVLERIVGLIETDLPAICADYDEASYLYPFWQQYQPANRGRGPKGDQMPWIEVGEHAVGERFSRLLTKEFDVRNPGTPIGSDNRCLISSTLISTVTQSLTSSVFLSVDTKSAGPRDNYPHIVVSPNQVSGDGVWAIAETGIVNSPTEAVGSRRRHSFQPTLPPLYVLADQTIAPVVTLAVRERYLMVPTGGQPLHQIDVICIPNGLLTFVNPGYKQQHPDLLFPGKDDKGKNPLKMRARVSFERLKAIAGWRVQVVRTSSALGATAE